MFPSPSGDYFFNLMKADPATVIGAAAQISVPIRGLFFLTSMPCICDQYLPCATRFRPHQGDYFF